ncbi:DegT/DnrJ/EryC1/StrS family aminotransferase [Hamadaea tsunoensis]|uniref:DegT/DnrJ/EryC1/StrS family aminotransferase n=1 Tax=Hamadaea tsunoensis TaxID=53368 RepID=UPI0004051C56|nr:DegT/DnrJ/EryC1/StrS family aminotransferase [Hamadaea tsunoensis]
MSAPIDTAHLYLDATDRQAVLEVLDAGDLSGTADIVADYETELATWFGGSHAIACSSGTAALHLALLALDVGRGDEVIVAATGPAMTALPILAVGATPVFADTAGPDTFALSLTDVERKLTPRTRAVICVPMWGYPADRPDLAAACHTRGIPLIEDASQAHGTLIDGQYAGTRATIGTFSTHHRKLIATGEGGFCLTENPDLDQRLRQLRNLGKQPGHGFGTAFGLNYKLPAIAAALGRTQLGRLTQRLDHRRHTLQTVVDRLYGLNGLHPLPAVGGKPNGYAAVFTTHGPAAPYAHRLAAAGITSDPTRYQYQALYHLPAFAQYAPAAPCANAETLTRSLITIPCHEGVGPHELDHITAALTGDPDA